MSTNLPPQRMELKAMLAGAAAKERRNLSLSIVFTLIVLAAGFGWIAYSANKVVKLKAQEADLIAAIAKLRVAIAEGEGVLREANLAIVNIRPELDKCAECNKTQDTKNAISALSSAQKSLQVLINDPVRVETRPQTQPSPTPARVIVPSVIRMSFTDADQKVRASGLTTTRVDQAGKASPGTVLYQDPLPDQRIAVNSPVTLYVVPNPSAASVSVPDLKGLTFEEASKRLAQLGLTARKVDQPGKGLPGTVLYQDPVTGRRISAGSQVSLYVIPKPIVVQPAP